MRSVIPIVLVTTMVFLSCSKTLENPIEPENSSIEKIHEDVIFQKFVLDIQRQAAVAPR